MVLKEEVKIIFFTIAYPSLPLSRCNEHFYICFRPSDQTREKGSIVFFHKINILPAFLTVLCSGSKSSSKNSVCPRFFKTFPNYSHVYSHNNLLFLITHLTEKFSPDSQYSKIFSGFLNPIIL